MKTLTNAQKTKLEQEHNVIIDVDSMSYNVNDTDYGWIPIPESWLYKITDIEIMDFNKMFEYEILSISAIQVNVEVNGFVIEYQTSGTMDAGAISTTLEMYEGNDNYTQLLKHFDNNEEKAQSFATEIKNHAEVQKIFNDYVEENYIKNDEYFGGMDARSEFDNIKVKE